MEWIGTAGYSLAALFYGAIALLLTVSHPGGHRATWLIAATAGSAVWAFGLAVMTGIPSAPVFAFFALDVLHLFLWIACALSYIAPGPAGSQPLRLRLYLSLLAGVIALLIIAAPFLGGVSRMSYPGIVILAAIGLLAVEQVFRNAKESQRAPLRYLCLAMGGVFVIDLLVYSQAMAVEGLIPLLWENRGLANLLLGPLLLLAVKRQSDWERELFVSRQVAFYTASLLGVGGYLVLMGAVAYLIRAFGGQWGALLQLAFLFGALGVLAIVLFSSTIRARFRVFLVKHFYRNKYDYRHEWLRLTEKLSRADQSRALSERALEGIAQIVGSASGGMWLVREDGNYDCVAALGRESHAEQRYGSEHKIVEFLKSKNWVIDSAEYAAHPDLYGSYFGGAYEGVCPADSLIVPLDCQGDLLGFVILRRPPHGHALNFEDHDILKTAGKQVAAVLAQARAQEQLAQTRQFEAMNKFAAFLMHDLKNVVAQQELVVANARRFRNRPEFVDDAFETIRSSVERMKKVLSQLRSADRREVHTVRVEANKVLIEVRSHCSDREPIPIIDADEEPLWVTMDRDQLVSVLTHLVRNSQDATPTDGQIELGLRGGDGFVELSVADTGCGMEPEFVRDRLFRPFDTTKGIRGMGIGAYQVRETVRASGGEVEVESEPGRGTTVRLRVPMLATSARESSSGV